MDTLALTYDLKDGSVGPQTIYLGAEIKKYQVKSGKSHWSMSSTPYVTNAVKQVEVMLREDGRELRQVKTSGKQVLPTGYCPELGQSAELSSELASRYLSLIGMLR